MVTPAKFFCHPTDVLDRVITPSRQQVWLEGYLYATDCRKGIIALERFVMIGRYCAVERQNVPDSHCFWALGPGYKTRLCNDFYFLDG